MRRQVLHFVRLVAVAAAVFAAAGTVRACTIPVFRYALERWAASPYQVVIFHKGELSSAERAAVETLEKVSANAQVVEVNVDAAMDEEVAAIWKRQAGQVLPRAVIRFPESGSKAPSLWEGTYDAKALGEMMDSPARRELAKRLVAGESCVWVVLDGKDKAAADTLAGRLEKHLARQQAILKLPEIAPDGPQLRSQLPLKLKFSMLRVSRDDPREATLVRMLRAVDPQFKESDEALVVPVIGRGRAVSALVASDVTEARVGAFAEFVCGQCSCEVKQMNPGIDLLMAADWDVIFSDGEGAAAVERPAPREAKAGQSVPIPVFEPEVLKAAAGSQLPAPATAEPVSLGLKVAASDSNGWLIVGVAVTAVLAVLSGAAALRGRRTGP